MSDCVRFAGVHLCEHCGPSTFSILAVLSVDALSTTKMAAVGAAFANRFTTVVTVASSLKQGTMIANVMSACRGKVRNICC